MRALLVIVFMLFSLPARGAEISCLQAYDPQPLPEELASRLWPSGYRPGASACMQALLQGPIVRGDYEKVLAFVRQHHRALNVLYLHSTGGDVSEAIRIGRLVRKSLLNVWAPTRNGDHVYMTRPGWQPGQDIRDVCRGTSCVCASACALIWFGSVNRYGQVGLHRPRITDPAYKGLPPADASVLYRRVLQDMTHYLEEMEVPRATIDTMTTTSSAEITFVDADDRSNELEHPPSFVEWINANCGTFTAAERKIASELQGRDGYAKLRPGAVKPLTAEEMMLSRLLTEKDLARSRCQTILVHSKRDALSAP